MPPLSLTTMKDSESAKLRNLEFKSESDLGLITHEKYLAKVELLTGKLISFKYRLPSFDREIC